MDVVGGRRGVWSQGVSPNMGDYWRGRKREKEEQRITLKKEERNIKISM